MKLLSAADVRQAAPMADVIPAMRSAFASLSRGEVKLPQRGVLEAENGITLTMPVTDERHISVKVVTLYPGNPQRGLPLTQAMLTLMDAETGTPLALMDARVLTGLRTGAVCGLATDLLSNPEAESLAVIGAGAMARQAIEAIRLVRPIREIKIFSRSRAQTLADEVGGAACDSVREATAEADIIVCATSSRTPVIDREDVKPGAHICGIGSFTPEMAEVAPDLVRAARVIVDHRESAWAESGDLLQAGVPRDHADTELGEVVLNQKPGRTSHEEITFFKSVGNAVQDLACARLVCERAQAAGLGADFDFG